MSSTNPGAKNSDGSRRTLEPAAASQPGVALVLAYDDFGPQVAAERLIGSSWYQWSKPGDFAPDDRFDVHVVVYEGDRAAIAGAYPTVADKADYRLVARADALAYLDAELAAATSSDPALRARLEATRKQVIDAFPAATASERLARLAGMTAKLVEGSPPDRPSLSWNDVNSFEHECGVDGYQLTMVERDGSWRVATASFQLIDCVDP